MASLAVEDGGDDVIIVLKCVDRDEQDDNNHNQDEDEVRISTIDVHNWNFTSILQHEVIKAEVERNRLIEHSLYFRGLLGGNFKNPGNEILVNWNQAIFLSLLASLFGAQVDFSSENFLSLYEGAYYFYMETVISKCKKWLTEAVSVNGATMLQLNDLVSIWEYGLRIEDGFLRENCTAYLAKNFSWAVSCSSFCDVPHELLVSGTEHPHLTVDSEKQLCEALLVWISANKERYTEDVCINLLKQIRASLLPVWFAAGKNAYQSLSMCHSEISYKAITVLKQLFTYCIIGTEDRDLRNLSIRLTEFTQKADLSGCPQINPAILLLSILVLKPPQIREIRHLLRNHECISIARFPWEICQILTFEAVHEIDMSNCPMLNLQEAVQIFGKSFPSLTKLKAANQITFRTIKLYLMVKSCPLLSDIDLTVDVSPIIPTRVSILKSLIPVTTPLTSSVPSYYLNELSLITITKLTLEGRTDIDDMDLRSISKICVSLTYINIRGCSSASDDGIAAFISTCLKLNSILACDTSFGQQCVLALCSSNACNLQMLHVGGCKGIGLAYFSKLMSHANMLKSLCLRGTQVVDDVLFNFFGSSLEVLDVSDTKVSGAGVAHVIGRNPGLKCLKTRGCDKLLHQETKNLFFEVVRCCKLDEISVGWGFSYLSLEALKAALSSLKAIQVGLGGSLGHDGLKWLPAISPLLESVVLFFQVISDDVIVNMLESLKHLRSFELCHCLGETSSLGFKVSMPNLRKLKLERVAPWMNDADLVNLTHNCPNLTELSLLGCPLLTSESQKIISSGWPGLISIHLEECRKVTVNGVVSLFNCHALEDILLRHTGYGIQRWFITDAVDRLPMLRKISLDTCDTPQTEFTLPEASKRNFLSHVKIANCNSQKCAFDLGYIRASRPLLQRAASTRLHQNTLVLQWNSQQFTKTYVRERV